MLECWVSVGSETCYRVYIDENLLDIAYCDRQYYLDKGCKIIDFNGYRSNRLNRVKELSKEVLDDIR
jgi:hypothetical protein